MSSSNTKLASGKSRVLITGGAGFIGTNLADRLAGTGNVVSIFDNLSRAGVNKNVEWLKARHGDRVRVIVGDVRDSERVKTAVTAADQVFHLAAQVAVTSSLLNPRYDYEVNVGGTLNVLESIRCMDQPASLVFTSTNKVYGDLRDLSLRKTRTRYQPENSDSRSTVSEDSCLEFHSPYGCSKGAADQYVLDFARSFGVHAAVFRMSCIYGPHQMGTEDQGWVAHFIRQALTNQLITICGDGLQVRDILFVDDLVNALLLAQAKIASLSGHAFNIGGGSANTISLLELIAKIEALVHQRPRLEMEDWRQGDQRYYVSNTQKFQSATGWSPKVDAHEGVRRLYEWLTEEYSSEAISKVGGEHALFAH